MTEVAFDTETTGLYWDKGDEPFLVQWADRGRPEGVHAHVGPGAAWAEERGFVPGLPPREALKALEAADVLIGQNLPFDIHMMREAFGVDLTRKRLKDTRLLAP